MRRTIMLLGLALAGLLLGVVGSSQRATISTASAATASEPYTIDWYTIDGGGRVAEEQFGVYTLSGTIGQPDAGEHVNAQYTLSSGFWGGIDARFLADLPWVER